MLKNRAIFIDVVSHIMQIKPYPIHFNNCLYCFKSLNIIFSRDYVYLTSIIR